MEIIGADSPFYPRRTSADRLADAVDIEPEAWLADVLRRINDHLASRLDELLPCNWKKLDRAETQAA